MSKLEDNKKLFFIGLGLLIVGATVGYSLGSVSHTNTLVKEEKIQEKIVKNHNSSHENLSDNTEIKREVSLAAKVDTKADEGKNEGSDVNEDIYKMDKGIDKLIRLANSDDRDNYQEVAQAKQALLNLAKRDTEALDELLEAYSDNIGNENVQALLFQVLSEVKDSKVESLATKLALSSDRNERIAGFDLLGELQIPSKENLNLSVEALQQEQGDKELVLSALHAMTPMPLSSDQNQEVVTLLAELTQNDNEAIRSESLLNIASWAKTESELDPVVKALDSEIADDKISAAMALEQSTVVGNDLKDTLLNKIKDPNELWEVRSMSANALGRFDLSTSEFSSLESFRAQQVGGVEH